MAGFLSNTAAMTVFVVTDGDKPNPDALRESKFEPVADPDDRRIGWVGLGDALDTEFAFGIDHGDYLAWSLRVDVRKPSGAAIKIRLAEAMKEEKEKSGGAISRARKGELKESVTAAVLAKTDYTPSLVDCIWNTATNRLYVGTTSEKVLDMLIPRFEATFKVQTEQLYPEGEMSELFEKIYREGLQLDAETTLSMNDSVVMRSPVHAEEKSAVTVENNPESVQTALDNGMRIVKMGIAISEEEQFVINGVLVVSSMKLPKREKGDDMETTFLLKADRCAHIARVIEQLSHMK